MTEYKTLKDLECNILVKKIKPIKVETEEKENSTILKITETEGFGFMKGYFKEDLKQETINWVKEDFAAVNNCGGLLTPEHIINKWMKRLNITEDDLK